MSFTVHSIPGSPFGRSVLATLVEKQLPFVLRPVDPQQLRDKAHLERHPFGRVPAIEHDGFGLYETQAILRYIDRIAARPSLTPENPRLAARMDRAMNVCDWYLFHGVADVITFQRIVAPRVLGLPADEEAVRAAMPRGLQVFAELSRLLGDDPWFAGKQFTLADLHLVPQLDLLAQTPEWGDLSAGTPNLVALIERATQRECFAATTWEKVSELARS